MTNIRELISLCITTHEPPSMRSSDLDKGDRGIFILYYLAGYPATGSLNATALPKP